MSKLSVQAYGGENAVIWLSEMLPRVHVTQPSMGTVNDEWQTFNFVWNTTNVTLSQQWQGQSVRFMAFETTFDLRDVTLQVQIQTQCSPDAYSCAVCDNATGSGVIPTNANYIVSDECSWECNPDFELRTDGTCLYCPALSCAVGFYMKDCGICAPCVSGDVNVVWLSAGGREGETSCASQCDEQFFRESSSEMCRNCTQGLRCSSDAFLVPCSDILDSYCRTCSRCIAGTTTSTSCKATADTSDTQCVPCVLNDSATGSLPEFAEWADVMLDTSANTYVFLPECSWECDTGYLHDPLLGICKVCEDICGVGEYHTECTAASGWKGCMPCEIPDNATATSEGRDLSNSCAWECTDQRPPTILDSGRVVCEAATPSTPVVVVVACTDYGRLSCNTGELYIRETCSCIACEPLVNASSTIARFVSRGLCDWVCVNPFMRVGAHCELLKRVETTTLVADVGSNSRPQIGLVSLTILPFAILLFMACLTLLRSS
jgi:hypothetical protein